MEAAQQEVLFPGLMHQAEPRGQFMGSPALARQVQAQDLKLPFLSARHHLNRHPVYPVDLWLRQWNRFRVPNYDHRQLSLSEALHQALKAIRRLPRPFHQVVPKNQLQGRKLLRVLCRAQPKVKAIRPMSPQCLEQRRQTRRPLSACPPRNTPHRLLDIKRQALCRHYIPP